MSRTRWFGVSCAALFAASPLMAQSSNPLALSKSQIIDEFARGSGIAGDAVNLSIGNTPAKLEKAQNYLTTVQIISQLADARDDAAASTAVDWVIGKVKDKVITGPAATALTAVTLYKASLEGLRDWVVLPRWDEQMYQTYKRMRIEGDTKAGGGPEVLETAFNKATGVNSAYMALKQRIYDEMVRAKGLDKEKIGPLYERALWAQIDAYLASRMELRYQRDYLKEHRAELLAATWREGRETLVTSTVATAPKPGTASADDEAVVARYKAAQEARINEWIAYDRKNGSMETQYRWEWVVLRLEGNTLKVASVVWQKYDKDHPWQTTSVFGSADRPFELSLSELRAKYPPK
jgi:hypothetical protein